MARKKIDFSVEEVFEEIVDMFNYVDSSLTEILSSAGGDEQDFYLIALGIKGTDAESMIRKKYDETGKATKVFTLENVKETFSSLIYDIGEIYEYAANGIIWDHNHTMDCLAGMDWICHYGTQIFEHWFQKNAESKTNFLYQLAYARFRLDEDDDLNIKNLALLAGVDERTIRNTASVGAFEIKKSGSSTIISNTEARRWLNTRPDFKATEHKGKSPGRIFVGHYTATEFGQFLALNRKEQNLTVEQVAQEIGVETDVLIDLEKGIDRIHLSQISKLQNLLKIEGNKLLNDYMEIFHYEEFMNLKHLFKAEMESKSKSEKVENN